MSKFPSYSTFVREVFGRDPYPWQLSTAEAFRQGQIPDLVDVPTGLGKSSVLAAAVWALAAQENAGDQRSMPQRIVHVVDRRRVVDEANGPLTRLARSWWSEASKPVPAALMEVHESLQGLAGPWLDPIVVQRIHGDSPDVGSWLRPTGCVVLGMTPHQLVSRLLFRGYGVSERTRSIHAGLVGLDSLLVVDEPHLSRQAITTIRQALAQQEMCEDLRIPPSRLVLLGATIPEDLQPPDTSAVIRLTDADLSSPAVTERLASKKHVRLVGARPSDAEFVKALVREHSALRSRIGPDRRIGLMVNTIARAQAVHAALLAAGVDNLLVTSRLRGTDRKHIESNLELAQTVVATQCLEVGVDTSFDALVTEECPYPVLVQRLGRLGRHGAPAVSEAAYLYGAKSAGRSRDEIGPTKSSVAVYGEGPLVATTQFLSRLALNGVVDLSLERQRTLRPEVPSECNPPPSRLATFHRGYHRLMSTTFPTPSADLPVEAFIVGPEKLDTVDVQVSWRADFRELNLCPPLPAEQVGVPVSAVRALLTGAASTAVADIPAQPLPESPAAGLTEAMAVVLRDGDWRPVRAVQNLRPGDRIVLHSKCGGYSDTAGWMPSSNASVSDHSILAAESAHAADTYRGGSFFMLSTSTLGPFLERQWPGAENESRRNATLAWAEDLPARLAEDVLTPEEVTDELDDLGLPSWTVHVTGSGDVIACWPNIPEGNAVGRADKAPRAHQSLAQHQQQVARYVRDAAGAVGLSTSVSAEVVAAARHHDDGKCHSPFQRYLGNLACVDDSINVDELDAWAKSRRGYVGVREDDERARRAGHDRRWRHEGLSAQQAIQRGASDLAVHLIASHHGRSRPLLSADVDGPGQRDASQARRFRELRERFGPWGLAYLEAVLRLSDWQASAHPNVDETVRAEVVLRPAPAPAAPSPPPNSHLLTGLVPTPMTGWFVVAGLLRAAADLGDESATVCWDPDIHHAGAPTWRSEIALTEIVREVLASKQWDLAHDYGRDLAASGTPGNALLLKNQKFDVSRAGAVLPEAALYEARLVTSLVQDSARAEGPRMRLALSAIANNSNYAAVATVVVSDFAQSPDTVTEEVTAALFDANRGWSRTQCDGGMDRPAPDGGIRGREGHGGRFSRSLLAPIALLGMAAYDVAGTNGLGVNSRGDQCILPRPTEPVDFETLGALTHAGLRLPGAVPTARYRRRPFGKSEILWVVDVGPASN